MAEQAGPLSGLTLNDQKLILAAFKSLKTGFELDYSKLAEVMEWTLKDDPTKPNAKKANNAWLVTRKKLFPEGFPSAAASEGGPAKAKASTTPRKKKEADTPKTPRAQQKTPAKKSQEIVESDGDTPLESSDAEEPAEDAPITPVAPTSIADEMSTRSGSPTPAPKKARSAGTTPKSKAEPKDPKTPITGSAGRAANALTQETTVTPVPKVTPKKRKTTAQNEAEAAAATSEGETDGNAKGSPPAKKHKAAGGKAIVPDEGNEGAADADSDTGESSGKPTPVKAPRKPSATQVAKREAKEKEKMEKKAEKEKEKADKKAEKERERAEKQAAKKKGGPKASSAADGDAESSKPKTPRKPSSAPQARKSEKGGSGKMKQEIEDKEMDEADAQAEAARIALAAQEEINRQANDVFNGARIDKPAKTDADASADDESSPGDTGGPQASGFIAINGNGNGYNGCDDGSSAGSEKIEEDSVEPATEQDGETVAVSQGETDAVDTVVGEGSA